MMANVAAAVIRFEGPLPAVTVVGVVVVSTLFSCRRLFSLIFLAFLFCSPFPRRTPTQREIQTFPVDPNETGDVGHLTVIMGIQVRATITSQKAWPI